MLFIELLTFTEQIVGLIHDDGYARFQVELVRQPEKGDVIPASGGLRKARMKLPGRGKSGGARVIYLYLKQHQTIVLFYCYTKSERENLTPAQLKRLRVAVGIIKEEFKV